jgi:hypothetical protein
MFKFYYRTGLLFVPQSSFILPILTALFIEKAGDENRTHITSLEGWSFTIKLRPQ